MNHSFVGAVAVASFWIFVAIVSVAGMMYDYRKKHLTVETLRYAIENGQKLDPAVLDRLLSQQRLDQAPEEGLDPRLLKIGGIITLAAGVGVFVLSFFIAQVAPVALYPIMGASLVVICVAIGLLVSANVLARPRPGHSGERRA
jgi:hypothetical protein